VISNDFVLLYIFPCVAKMLITPMTQTTGSYKGKICNNKHDLCGNTSYFMHITSLPLLAFLDIIGRNLTLLKYFNPDAILDASYYVWIYNKHCKLKSLTLYFYSILRQIHKTENQIKIFHLSNDI